MFRWEAHPSGVVAFQLVYLDVLSLEWSSIPSKVAVEVRVLFQASGDQSQEERRDNGSDHYGG